MYQAETEEFKETKESKETRETQETKETRETRETKGTSKTKCISHSQEDTGIIVRNSQELKRLKKRETFTTNFLSQNADLQPPLTANQKRTCQFRYIEGYAFVDSFVAFENTIGCGVKRGSSLRTRLPRPPRRQTPRRQQWPPGTAGIRSPRRRWLVPTGIWMIGSYQIVHVGLCLSEFHLVHAFTCVPMQESLAPEHGCELLGDALEELLDGGAVAHEGGGHLEGRK